MTAKRLTPIARKLRLERTEVEDRLRTRSLEQAGYVVLRFWNSDVTGNLDGVLEEIRRTLLIARGEPTSSIGRGRDARSASG